MRLTKSELRVVRCAEQVAIAERLIAESGPGLLFVTRRELAAALKVSLRTVERMLENGDITRMKGLPSDIVRFYLPDVMKELRRGKHKFGRAAARETTGPRTADWRLEPTRGQKFEQEETEIAERGQGR